MDPVNILFRERLARALTISGELAEAEKEYRRLLEAGETGRETYYQMGRVVQGLGRAAEAADWFEQALQSDPGYEPAKEALADLKEMLKTQDESSGGQPDVQE